MILIIENNAIIRSTLKEILSFEGYSVITAKNGKEGYDQILEHEPLLVFSEVNLPKMDGFHLIKKVKLDLDSSKFPYWIFLTVKSEVSTKQEGLRLGAHEFILKPYNSDHLLDILKQYKIN